MVLRTHSPLTPLKQTRPHQLSHVRQRHGIGDEDADGFGNAFAAMDSCESVIGYVLDNTDCDDNDADAYPGQLWFMDADGDGHGDQNNTLEQCPRPQSMC